HWLNLACRYSPVVSRAGLPLTIRGHDFTPSADLIGSLQHDDTVASLYLPPHIAAAHRDHDKVRSMSASFNGDLYYPGAAKDPRLVVRYGPALPSMDYLSFFQTAQACPRHRFVLVVAACAANERYVEELASCNRSLGSPVELHVDLPSEQ